MRTGTAGSRASLNQNQLITTLIRTIDNDRLEFLKSLASLRSQNLDSYTVEAILCRQKCSIGGPKPGAAMTRAQRQVKNGP
ncbi:MAG: hypothetical protein AAF568_10060 [Pseudomonadota bacterium]